MSRFGNCEILHWGRCHIWHHPGTGTSGPNMAYYPPVSSYPGSGTIKPGVPEFPGLDTYVPVDENHPPTFTVVRTRDDVVYVQPSPDWPDVVHRACANVREIQVGSANRLVGAATLMDSDLQPSAGMYADDRVGVVRHVGQGEDPTRP